MTSLDTSGYDRILVASYRLPFRVSEENSESELVQNSGGLVSAILSLSEKSDSARFSGKQILWFGTGDERSSALPGLIDQNKNYSVFPLVLDRQTESDFYHGFSNDFLWPLFHYFTTLAKFNDSYFNAYIMANESFCEAIFSQYRSSDIIWIHDYQLLPLAAMLRKKLPNASIGFFLHIPFPSFEIFRLMPGPWRSSILNGMLGADLIGFHTYDYVRYFINTVNRTLGYEISQSSVNTGERLVHVDAFPIGIDVAKFRNASRAPAVNIKMSELKESISGCRLIFSVDRLDYTKGFLNRLEGFEYFLETFPEWHGKVIFNMVTIPSRDTIPVYQSIKKEIESTVGRINGKYGTLSWRPIAYQYKSLSFEEMVALYSLSEIALITPLRDGMNLVAKEFVVCQTGDRGVLILSEMAGAAAELGEAVIINPSDRKEVGNAINRALCMPQKERKLLLSRMQKRLAEYDVFKWADDFLEQLFSSKKIQESRKVNILNPDLENEILRVYNQSSKRVLFFDYDGTLVPFSKFPEMSVISSEALNNLEKLAENPANSIVIISGRNKDFLEETFKDLKVYLIAEHGAFIMPPGGEWECKAISRRPWKSHIRNILQRYVNRCNGSFIEEKETALVWHYRNADTELGNVRAGELRDELRDIVSHEPDLHMIDGHKVIEIKLAGYDKGGSVYEFLSKSTFDFVLAIGDDRTDEDIFNALPGEAYTFRIGMEPSSARFNIKSRKDVDLLIARLAENNL